MSCILILLESQGGTAMAAARVEVDQINRFHDSNVNGPLVSFMLLAGVTNVYFARNVPFKLAKRSLKHEMRPARPYVALRHVHDTVSKAFLP
jgi:hypothetical protein